MGGLLPEQADQPAFLAPFHRVLDVAYGPGGWVLEMAHMYPHLQVMGFDIDARMISYATVQAQASGLDNAHFRVIDWSVGMEAHRPVFEVLGMFIKLVQPFLIKMGLTTQEEADQLYREAEIEMLSDNFCALWYFLTVWGEKPQA